MASATREEQRSVIRFLTIQGESAANIHSKLVNVYGSHALSDSAVRKWKREFVEGEEERARPGTCRQAKNNGHSH